MSDQNAALFDKLDGFYVTKSEHDWLERRFSNMTEKEKILFQGAMELEKPQEIGHVMRIASQLDCYDLFYGAGDEAALGKFVMESIECSSDAARPFLNAEHLGAAYHQSQNGAFCNGHYVRNIKLADPFVEEDPTLQPVAGDYAIRVKLASRSNMEGIWVGFPDSGEYIDSNHPDELLLGLDSLQAESLSECIALEVDCCLPQLTGILDQYDSASELVRHAIDFGYVWAEQGQGAPHWLDKWQAVLELEDCHRLDLALDLAQNLQHYEFFPRGMDLAAYGRELAVRNGVIPPSRLITDAFDGAAYAEANMGQYGLSTTDHGYPNIEYALASGMSFLCTDTKGDLFRNYAGIAKDCYGYQIAVLDLRNPTRSDGNNLLHLINKYMDIYKADPKNLAAKAKAEKYSKILAKTLINTSGGDSAQYGQNAFFYDSAEGLLTAMFLLVAEYLPTEDADGNPIEKRHIVSVFKLVQELLAPSRVKGKNQFQLLLEKLPPNHKARWFAGSALNTAEQAMASVISTVLSRLNAFLDSEMEQILCFDTAIDAEKFCNEKSAIFIVLPEEDQTKYFMVSLILQNLYREILTVADENGGRLKNRVVFFADELGTCPPIQSLELMFSASRSRGLMLVPIVQSITGQLQKNYGKEGSEIIVDNCQVNLYGGFAPASQTAVELSKSLGSRTVMSGSISRGKNDPSQSLQMMERPLMTPDELKSMPKGSFIVAKTGVHPMKVKLRLFLDWGIRFGMPYEVPEKAQRFVAYADKQELEESIIRRHYGTIVMDSEQPQGGGTSAGGMAQGIQAAPDSRKTVFRP